MKKLIESIVPILLGVLIKLLPPEKLERVADKALDWCEDAIQKSATDLDNAILLPLINLVREAFGIEDNDVSVSK